MNKLMDIVTLKEARAAGLKRYFTGLACKHGHISDRRVAGRSCVACTANESVRVLQAARGAAWYKKNREQIRADGKASRAAKDPIALALAEKRRVYLAGLSDDAREKIRAADRARYATERDHAVRRKNAAAWRVANIDMKRAYNRNRKAIKKLAEGKHSGADIAALLLIQRKKCAHPWCRKSIAKVFHVDHIVPLSKGGSNGPKNLQLLCPPCNLQKQASDPIAFAQRNGSLL